MMGGGGGEGSLKILLSCGWLSIRCHFPMSVSFALGMQRRMVLYYKLKSSIFLRAVLLFCASDISPSERI